MTDEPTPIPPPKDDLVVFKDNFIDGRGIIGYESFGIFMKKDTAEWENTPVDVGPQAGLTEIRRGESFRVEAWPMPSNSRPPAEYPDRYSWVTGAAGPLVTPGETIATDGKLDSRINAIFAKTTMLPGPKTNLVGQTTITFTFKSNIGPAPQVITLLKVDIPKEEQDHYQRPGTAA
jgi:hypothetical protein